MLSVRGRVLGLTLYWHVFYFWHVQIYQRQNALKLVCDGNVFDDHFDTWFIYSLINFFFPFLLSLPNKETRLGISANYVL